MITRIPEQLPRLSFSFGDPPQELISKAILFNAYFKYIGIVCVGCLLTNALAYHAGVSVEKYVTLYGQPDAEHWEGKELPIERVAFLWDSYHDPLVSYHLFDHAQIFANILDELQEMD